MSSFVDPLGALGEGEVDPLGAIGGASAGSKSAPNSAPQAAYSDPLLGAKAASESVEDPLTGGFRAAAPAPAPASYATPPASVAAFPPSTTLTAASTVPAHVTKAAADIEVGEDPLSMALASGVVRTVAQPSSVAATAKSTASIPTSMVKHSPYLDWASRKSAILKEYTATGKIAISAVCDFLRL